MGIGHSTVKNINDRDNVFGQYVADETLHLRSPHPLFWPQHDLIIQPDVHASEASSILHNLKSEASKRRYYSLFFDVNVYMKAYGVAVEETSSGTILEDFSKAANRSVASPSFDADHYRAQAGAGAPDRSHFRLRDMSDLSI